MKLLSYNTRGIGSRAKGREIRSLISREKIDLACFQETKLSAVNNTFCSKIWGNEDIEWACSPAVNRGGGLLCIWRKCSFNVTEITCNQRWISLKGRWPDHDEDCIVVNIYAPCGLEEKRQLWLELEDWRSRNSSVERLCIMGDFNAVRDSRERRGIVAESSQFRRETAQFNEFIDSMELVDIPMSGKNFTWFRPNGSSMSRLDRCLVTLAWLDSWPHCVQHVLDREFSDHCPIVLKHMDQEWGPKPFRVLNCWLKDPRFHKFVEDGWNGLVINGSSSYVLKEKLKQLKVMMKKWNTEVFGNLGVKKKEVVLRMKELDQIAEDSQLSEEEIKERKDLMTEYWRVLNLNESLLCQKSRIQWLREGDANTRFFHGVVNWRRRSKAAKGISLNGQWEENPGRVKEGVKQFFESKFSESVAEIPNLDGVEFNQISAEDNEDLIAEFEMEEIKAAVWACEGNKSPGPDGYNFRFIKEF